MGSVHNISSMGGVVKWNLFVGLVLLVNVEGSTRGCSHDTLNRQAHEGSSMIDGCIRKTCKAGIWRPSMVKSLCCFNNEAIQPGSTISESTSSDGCIISTVQCVLQEHNTAKMVLKIDRTCGEPSTKEQFVEIKELLEIQIAEEGHCKETGKDEKVVEKPIEPCTWTDWLDRDNTTQKWGDTGDFEEFDQETSKDGFTGCLHTSMKMRVVGQSEVYLTKAQVLSGTGDVVHITEKGMFCKWTTGEQDDGKCEDYEVQFCCP